MTIREQIEAREKAYYSPYAKLASDSRGREKPEEECPYRTAFARDRDRIIHSNSYRRLMHKTQVFLSPEGDHYRTRMTHTAEVCQIALTISKGLALNEDLTEAIAMGHDLGHTPFGHCGERALNAVCSEGFEHTAQSVRVVEYIERGGRGLNLTWEVKNGIACHSSSCPWAETLEGRVVRYADKIAYLNHDIDDAIRAEVLQPGDIPWDVTYVLGRGKSQRITTLVASLLENSGETIQMAPEVEKALWKLREFMFEAVYTNPKAKGEESKAEEVVKRLFAYYIDHQEQLPEEYRRIAERFGRERAACDYIAGMSDRYAISLYEELFIPRAWGM